MRRALFEAGEARAAAEAARATAEAQAAQAAQAARTAADARAAAEAGAALATASEVSDVIIDVPPHVRSPERWGRSGVTAVHRVGGGVGGGGAGGGGGLVTPTGKRCGAPEPQQESSPTSVTASFSRLQ